MTIWGFIVSLVVGLAINEASDVAPWLARRLIGWAARSLHADDPDAAELYQEELERVIEDAPGKLVKLIVAFSFTRAAIAAATARRAGIVLRHGRACREARSARVQAGISVLTLLRARDVLAGLVFEQWRNEALLRLVGDLDPIPVRWRVTRDEQVIDHPASLTGRSQRLKVSSDQVDALVGEFRGMRRRRLVILGGPGTGKTTLAVQLLLGLLSSPRPDEPVPVLLPVAGWDTTAFPRLHDWLAVRLEQDYPALGSGTAEALAKRGHVLPVLDGLDELQPSAQARVITALNRSLSDTDQVILTSRTIEYARAVDAGEELTSAMVIQPEPLDPVTAADHLERCLAARRDPAWARVLSSLRAEQTRIGPAAALSAVASTPFGLWLLHAVYVIPRCDPAPLLHEPLSETGALRAHLLERLIPALIGTRPPGDDPVAASPFRPRRHGVADVRRYLGYLADYLNHIPADNKETGTRDFAWWQLARHTLNPHALRLVSGLSTGRHHAWLLYVVATYRLARRRVLPRRLMPFLDDMHRLGLLRAVGPIYQFRHAELQDHLAVTYRSSHERVSA